MTNVTRYEMSPTTAALLDEYRRLLDTANARRLEWFERDRLATLRRRLGALTLDA